MVTIRFTCKNDETKLELGHRIIVFSGTVVYTPQQWQYQVPLYVVKLLRKKRIPFRIVEDI